MINTIYPSLTAWNPKVHEFLMFYQDVEPLQQIFWGIIQIDRSVNYLNKINTPHELHQVWSVNSQSTFAIFLIVNAITYQN